MKPSSTCDAHLLTFDILFHRQMGTLSYGHALWYHVILSTIVDDI